MRNHAHRCLLASITLLLLLGMGMQEVFTGVHRLALHPLGYIIQGDRSAVVVTHGGMASKESMLPIAWALAHRGHTVIAADLPAHGHSTLLGGPDIGASKKAWQQAVTEGRVRQGIGHSLGSIFLCPSRTSGIAVPSTVHIGLFEQCPPRRGTYGQLVPIPIPGAGTYHIDHLLEPWNPYTIADAVNEPIQARHFFFGLWPWMVFIAGLLAAVSWQRRLSAQWSVAGRSPISIGTMSALVMVGMFILVAWRRLWYPFPAGWADLAIGGIVACPPMLVTWLVHRWMKGRAHSVVTGSGFYLWSLGSALLVTSMYQGWPKSGVLTLYPSLVFAVLVLSSVVARCCRFQTSLGRRVCHIWLTSYGMMLLFPRWNPLSAWPG